MKKFITWILLLIVVAGCKGIQYVPVETVRTETKYIDKIQHDSIYIRDSIRTLIKGDTLYVDRWKETYKYIYINKTDSFCVIDSIQVPYPVERKLNRWESMKMELGGWAFGILVTCIIAIIVWLVILRRRR